MEKAIRDIINREDFFDKYFKDHLDDWNILCSAMDVIGDTTLAIQNFLEEDMGDDGGENYLKLYGLLQAVFLQQDAIKFLYNTIKKSFDKKEKLEKWDDLPFEQSNILRNYRNLSAGHPVECNTFESGMIKRSFISRTSISSDGFDLLVWDEKTKEKDSPRHVNLKPLISSYISEAKRILADLENFLLCLK